MTEPAPVPQPPGFALTRLFPVEGDSAVAELSYDGEMFADVRLEGMALAEVGPDRTADARCVVRVFPRSDGAEPAWHELELDAVLAQLAAARAWLMENEHGRTPSGGRDGLTAAGAAYDKMGAQAARDWVVAPAFVPPPAVP